MVSVVHSVASQSDFQQFLTTLSNGVSDDEQQDIKDALQFAWEIYDKNKLSTGEQIWNHALGMALIAAGLRMDARSRIAALLFAVHTCVEKSPEIIEQKFGIEVEHLVEGLARLDRLRSVITGLIAASNPDYQNYSHLNYENRSNEAKAQIEIWRKMLLAMVADIRVVLLRLASRTQTMRYYAGCTDSLKENISRETLDLYAPLANRLGVWELKWELEDLSFRFLQPDTYKKIAKMIDERRIEREHFIADAVEKVKSELLKLGVKKEHIEVYGRPKHIYSIWNKMRRKGVEFDEVYDVRALRIIVDTEKQCYDALSIVNNLWTPIESEFDDYIAKPKGNNYRSLHTAVRCADGKSLEIQIRTWEMHKHAELGIAAHWRYKENKTGISNDNYDEKIAFLRRLLTWNESDEYGRFDSNDENKNQRGKDEPNFWENQYRKVAFNEIVYVITPQGKVIDLPKGSTPLDFAYRIHTNLGHRCRGAKVDNSLVALNTPLQSGQCVEILTAKDGTPSRDWLNPELKYLQTKSAKIKVRSYFSNLQLEKSLTVGKEFLNKEIQRTINEYIKTLSAKNKNENLVENIKDIKNISISIEDLAQKLNYAKVNDLAVASAREEISIRQIQNAINSILNNVLNINKNTGSKVETNITKNADNKFAENANINNTDHKKLQKLKSADGILIVGVDKLLTQLAGCCKPTPPDEISGFITRGKGVSIHRCDCQNYLYLASMYPEKIIKTDWGNSAENHNNIFACDVLLDANDRQGLLRDISAVFTKERINVIGVNTSSKDNKAKMKFTVEIKDIKQLQKALNLLHTVDGVIAVRRG